MKKKRRQTPTRKRLAGTEAGESPMRVFRMSDLEYAKVLAKAARAGEDFSKYARRRLLEVDDRLPTLKGTDR